MKQDWVVELRLARLALDPNNAPGWDILEQVLYCTIPYLSASYCTAFCRPTG